MVKRGTRTRTRRHGKNRHEKSKKSPKTPARPDLDLDGIETLLVQCDATVEASAQSPSPGSNIQTVMGLYQTAEEALRSMLLTGSTPANDMKDDHGGDEEMETETDGKHNNNKNNNKKFSRDRVLMLLAQLASRRGDLRASYFNDVEGARAEFQEAIDLLEVRLSRECLSNEAQESAVMDVDMDSHANAPLKGAFEAEIRHVLAGLYLYQGQLSEGDDTLKANQAGIRHLEKALQHFVPHDDNNQAEQQQKEQQEELQEQEQEEVHPLEEERKIAARETRKQLIGAYCSLAELYLTDLCYEPDAEQACERAIQAALQHDAANLSFYHQQLKQRQRRNDDMILEPAQAQEAEEGEEEEILAPPSPDALQAAANLCLSQSRTDEATKRILQAWKRMEGGCTSLATYVGLGPVEEVDEDAVEEDEEKNEMEELRHVNQATSLPTFEFRRQTAKILLECASSSSTPHEETTKQDASTTETTKAISSALQSECVEAAIRVLGSMLAENDEDAHVWFLVGCAFTSLSPSHNDDEDDQQQQKQQNEEMATYYFKQAKDRLLQIKKQLVREKKFGEDVKEELEEVKGQLEEVNEKIHALKKEG